ncbi:hypothetical protein HMPREF1544_09626 [Mucor circinelloides 1006PhL]|uniref:EH domain-containing protein n=1 Tax=Mucor circinelloides f. circinelloides (strain 1006PhL) TaxID=1220926 RepID=S2JV07_MUCC1|nr:hypothetical protein HMPREF1544_09626 [Mucor circinelloides 1006PhL]KAG1123380.1 hypothetical protein G6F42_010607 [Rhizopus arrhizus]
MNKLFRRHHQEPVEKRSGAFIKRLEESKRSAVDSQRESEMEALTATPKVQVDDLSDIELSAYQAWWKDLDPFHIGRADNEAVLNFVSGCGLPDHKLEEILALFQDQKEGLAKEQFFAILRLIAHAQNGRMISRDIVYLGAPLPRFQTQAIDAIIKRSQQQQQQADDFAAGRSYDSTSNHSNISTSPMPSWMMPMNKVVGAQSTIIPNAILNTTPTKSPYTPTHVSHSRSRSVPYNFLSQIDDNINQITDASFDRLPKPEHQRRSANHSSHVSMDADSLQKIMDTGQSLLLTQSFRPNFIDDDDDDDDEDDEDDCKQDEDNEPGTTTVNSVESSNSSSGKLKQPAPHSYNPYLIAASNTNPFETDDSSSTTPAQTPTLLPLTTPTTQSTLHHQTVNTCMNSRQVPPPPVPPQSTKPAYPKYARRTMY